MEGYYVEKTWFVFESHSRNTFCERNFCEEGGVMKASRDWQLDFCSSFCNKGYYLYLVLSHVAVVVHCL